VTRWKAVRLVAVREVVERLRSKAFVLSSAVSLVVVLVLAVLPGVLGDDDPQVHDVVVAGDGAAALVAVLDGIGATPGGDGVEAGLVDDAAEAERLVRDGEVDVAVVGGELVVRDDVDDALALLLQEAHRQVAGAAALAEAGVSGDVAARALAPAPLERRVLEPVDEDDTDREALVFVGTVLLYGQLVGFGYWVASGVVEEKSSRVVEVLLAKVDPRQVLAGKILGIGLLGFVQLVGFVALGLGAAAAAGSVELPPETVRVAAEVLAWFVLGFAFYAALFAAGGALASRAEELQSTTGPLTFVGLGSFFAAVAAVGDPSGVVARVATFLPPAAPMVLPIRSAAGELPLVELLGGVALVLVAVVAVVRLAARVYQGGALHLRGQLRLRDALRMGRG